MSTMTDTNTADTTAALFAAIDSGNEDRVIELINAGADIFATDAEGASTLTHAQRQGNEIIIQTLQMMAEAQGKEFQDAPDDGDAKDAAGEEEPDDGGGYIVTPADAEKLFKLGQQFNGKRQKACYVQAAEYGCSAARYERYCGDVDLIVKHAVQGDARAQFLLGQGYCKDFEEHARFWLSQSAQQGEVEAALLLVSLATEQSHSLPDMETLCEALRLYPQIRQHPQYDMFERAIRGFRESQRELADYYDQVEEEEEESLARAWYREAAARGDSKAQIKMAELCRGVKWKKDDYSHYLEAAAWYIKAAQQGETGAYCRASDMYERYIRERIYYGKNDEFGHVDCWFKIGHCYACQMECCRRAAELGSEEALQKLKELRERNIKKYYCPWEGFDRIDSTPEMGCWAMLLCFVLMVLGLFFLNEEFGIWMWWCGFGGFLVLDPIPMGWKLCIYTYKWLRSRSALVRGTKEPMIQPEEAYVRANGGRALEIKQQIIAPAPSYEDDSDTCRRYHLPNTQEISQLLQRIGDWDGEDCFRMLKAAEFGNVEAALYLVALYTPETVVHWRGTIIPNMETLCGALRLYPEIRRHPLYGTFEMAIRGGRTAQRVLAAYYAKANNEAVSRYWYETAARQGDAEAQYQWAKMEPEIESPAWFILAARQGRENAYYEAGKVYETCTKNVGWSEDLLKIRCYALAQECYRRDAERGSNDAKLALKNLQNKIAKAYPWWHYTLFNGTFIPGVGMLVLFALSSEFWELGLGIVFIGWGLIEAWNTSREKKRLLAAPDVNLDESYLQVSEDGFPREVKQLPLVEQRPLAPAPEDGRA